MSAFRAGVRCVVLATIVAAACKPQGPAPLSDADKAAMQQVADQALAIFTSPTPDWAAFAAALYTEDATVMPPNAPAVKGQEAIVALLKGFPPIADFKQVSQHVEGFGNLAYDLQTYAGTFAPPGLPPVADTGKVVWIWRKGADGSWKILVEMWSSDLPVAPTSEPAATQRK
jgi:ketosteroid isomerase-like protein